jgi:hypothetical protein
MCRDYFDHMDKLGMAQGKQLKHRFLMLMEDEARVQRGLLLNGGNGDVQGLVQQDTLDAGLAARRLAGSRAELEFEDVAAQQLNAWVVRSFGGGERLVARVEGTASSTSADFIRNLQAVTEGLRRRGFHALVIVVDGAR